MKIRLRSPARPRRRRGGAWVGADKDSEVRFGCRFLDAVYDDKERVLRLYGYECGDAFCGANRQGSISRTRTEAARQLLRRPALELTAGRGIKALRILRAAHPGSCLAHQSDLRFGANH